MYESNLQEIQGTLTLASGVEPGTMVIGATSAEGWKIADCEMALSDFGMALCGLSHIECAGRAANLHRLDHSDKAGADDVSFVGRATLMCGSHGVRFLLVDCKAVTAVLQALFTEQQFAELVLKHAISVTFKVRNPERIGRVYQSESRSIEYPGTTLDGKKKMEAWLAEHGKQDGWHVNARLDSQGSVSTYQGKATLNYSIYRYV